MASIIPNIVVEVVATVSGVIISVGVPLILAKINKFGKVYTTVFGVDDVDSMSGLVGVVEAHDDELENIEQDMDVLKNGQGEIQNRIARLEESVRDRTQHSDDD